MEMYSYCIRKMLTKLLPIVLREKSFSRSYAIITREKQKLSKLCGSISRPPADSLLLLRTINSSSASHLNPKLQNLGDGDVLSVIPLKFDDMTFEQPVPHEELLTALHKCKNVEEQMETLASVLTLSPEDVQNRIKFCKSLESLFKPFFQDFRIQIYGSTVNGYGFKGCDIDMSFETSADRGKKIINYNIEPPDIPFVGDVISGKVSPQEISELPRREQLIFIHNVLSDHYKESKRPSIFINCHVPLVRFYHDKFNLKCDLTFKNKGAFANSKLLYFFTKMDKRVIPLMTTVRYWGKNAGLIGRGGLFNTYSVTLMVIFFLQTRDPPILPTAELVLSLSNSFESYDMNDKSFLSLREKVPPSENKQSLAELLKEFFLFYTFFDYERVICPLTATAIPRDEILSKEENFKFRIKEICIQDPLCASNNVAELVDYQYVDNFLFELLKGCQIFQDSSLLNPSSEPWGLISILNAMKKSKKAKKSAAPKTVSFTVPLVHRYDKSISGAERISVTTDTLLKIFHRAFLFSCKPLERSTVLGLLKRSSEKSTNELLRNFHAENDLVFATECTVTKNVWQGRDLVRLSTSCDSDNVLDREHLVSTNTAEQNGKRKKIEPFTFLCESYVSANMPETLLINCRPLKKNYFNLLIGIFLQHHIPRIMKNIDEST